MMNSQEREQLSQFLQQLTEVKLAEKNPEAETMIRAAAERQADALYLLVQRSLLLEQALNAAKSRIDGLEKQVQQQSSKPSPGGFFGNDPWAQGTTRANAVPGVNNYQPAPANASANGLGFLGDIATTAAGVVAGSFLFQGIENLLGHRQSAWGLGQQPFGEHVTEQTVINNYYDDPVQTADAGDYGNSPVSGADGDFFDDSGNSDSDWI